MIREELALAPPAGGRGVSWLELLIDYELQGGTPVPARWGEEAAQPLDVAASTRALVAHFRRASRLLLQRVLDPEEASRLAAAETATSSGY